MISKWGMDGALNQANYKQKMTTDDKEDSASTDDSSIFMGSLVGTNKNCFRGTNYLGKRLPKFSVLVSTNIFQV